MSSFLRILRRATMFPSDLKRGTAKQTTTVEKAPKSVTSGNHNSKSNKKEFYPPGRGRLQVDGTITDKDFENLHHRIVCTNCILTSCAS
jgi:hypothetical protein